jgi:CheY-like chemotaxis protein
MALASGAAAFPQMPVSRCAPNMAGTNSGFGNPLSQSQRVLVADDADNFMAARPTTGFSPPAADFTPGAEHGREAIAWLRRVPSDRILLKARMPELNGLPAVQLPQCDTRTTATPVIIATAKRVSQDRQVLTSAAGKVLQIHEEPGFNRVDFTTEVRRGPPQG